MTRPRFPSRPGWGPAAEPNPVMRRRSASSTSTFRPSNSSLLTDRGHARQPHGDISHNPDGLEVPRVGNLHAQPLGDVIDIDLPVEHEPVSLLPVDDRLGLDVVLVANLADDLLEQILDRHEAGRPAVLVDDDRALRLLPLELLQQPVNARVSGHDNVLGEPAA